MTNMIGERVEMQVGRGWFGGRFYSGGSLVARVLCVDPDNTAFAVAVTRDGRLWRMVNPACLRTPR